jgi:hypothetical protein
VKWLKKLYLMWKLRRPVVASPTKEASETFAGLFLTTDEADA